MSFLSTIGKDFKAVFAFLGSTRGQAVVASTEGLIEAVATAAGAGAPVQGALNLINLWGGEVIKTETLAAAAGQQNGTGTQKAEAVIAAMTPQAIDFAKANGLAAPTAASLAVINNSVVAALDALSPTPVAASPATHA